MLVQKSLFVFAFQFPPVWDALVMIMRDEVEDVLFKVCTGATDRVYFVLANHFGQREPKFGRAHRACDRDQHFAALLQVIRIAFCGIFQRCRIKMPEMMRDEFRDSFHGAKGGYRFSAQFKGF